MIVRRITGWPTWDWKNPMEELERMRREMERVAGDISGGSFREPAAGVFPLLNVTEGKDVYYVRAELPGIKAEDFDISVTGNNLSISGERKIPVESDKAKYHRREREAGKFSRMISLPAQIDTAKVEARCSEGVLTMVLPKSESAKPKQITVKTS